MKQCAVLLLVLVVAALAGPDDAPSPDVLVSRLGDPKYSVRKEAAAALRAMGPKAIEALERAAKSEDPEVALVAAEILKDARLGIEPDWPADLAAKIRGCDKLDQAARVELIRRAFTELKDRAAPFMVSRLATGDVREAFCVYECLTNDGSGKMARAMVGLMQDPRNAGEARALGWAYAKLNRPADALRVLAAQHADEQTIREITETTVRNILGSLEQKQFKEAEDLAGLYAKAAPSEARFLYLQARALEGLGRNREAEALQGKALELKPDSEAAHYVAGDMLMNLGQNELSAREWELILKIPPADDVYDINAYLRLGRINDHLQRYDAAAESLEKALNLYKAKRAGGRAGYGLMGATEADLTRKIAALREKAGKSALVAGDKGEQVRLRVKAILKDGKPGELKKAISSADCSMTLNVQPLGLRVLDDDVCTIAYNREKEEIAVMLNNQTACTPRKVPDGNRRERMTAVVNNLDCIYIVDIDTVTGKAKRVARFEMDYTVKVELDEAIRDYRSAPLKIGDTECGWDDLLKGTTVDYLPPVLELRLEGKQPDGTLRTLNFRIPIRDGSSEMTDEEKKGSTERE